MIFRAVRMLGLWNAQYYKVDYFVGAVKTIDEKYSVWLGFGW